MRGLFHSRGRAIAVVTILVTSVLLTWVTWSAMSSPSGTTSRPGIDITPRPTSSGSAAPESTAPPGATESPSGHHSPQAVEPAAPAAVDPHGQAGQQDHSGQGEQPVPPAAPQAPPAAPQEPPAAPQAPPEDDDADDPDDSDDAAELDD